LPSSGPRPKAGETILVQGGAGGVAGFGVQLAKHLEATAIATASASNHYYVGSLGADRVDFAAVISNCDVAFRCRMVKISIMVVLAS
jgi:NADPH:quinone reductase-like Zn-dependent oxidoreductase